MMSIKTEDGWNAVVSMGQYKKWNKKRAYRNLTTGVYTPTISSNIVRKPIRNAVTGDAYPINVGEIEEERFWRVMDATGYDGERSPRRLYFDSPEQYEQQRKVQVNHQEKQDWYNKVRFVHMEPDTYLSD